MAGRVRSTSARCRCRLGDEAVDVFEMILPTRRPPAGQPLELRRASWRIGRRGIEDRRAPARPVERIEVFGDVAAGFAQGRDVAAQYRHADPEGLDQREPETLGE